jgi:hypothetical protein
MKLSTSQAEYVQQQAAEELAAGQEPSYYYLRKLQILLRLL